jgi:predicted phage terminase large subunit-like protein
MNTATFEQLSSEEQRVFTEQFTPRWNKYLLQFTPTPKQAAFLCLEKFGVEEALYGGAAGGGKSFALLMAGLQYVDVPGYHGLLLRRSYTDLSLPGALMDLSMEVLRGTDAHWDGLTKSWKFPSRATLGFGYLDTATDPDRYMSAAFHFIGIDEASQIPWRWMQLVTNSRMRKEAKSNIPLRIRYSSNPGGISHEDLKAYFVDPRTAKGVFIPATLDDNPYLAKEDYKRSLSRLDPLSRQRLLEGNWDALPSGTFFSRGKLVERIVDSAPLEHKFCRFWDFAATVPRNGSDPDWTVGALLSQNEKNETFIHDIRRFRCRPSEVEAKIRETALEDGRTVPIWLEQEPGSSGVAVVDHYIRNVLNGWEVYGHKTTGEKSVRAGPFASQVEAGHVYLIRAMWNRELLDEFEAFPNGSHDDIVDACSGAFNRISEMDATGDFGFTCYVPKRERL